MTIKNIIILGANGSVGSGVISRIKGDNVNIFAVDKEFHGVKEGKNIKYIKTDFLDVRQIDDLLDNLPSLGDEDIIISAIGSFGCDYQREGFDYDQFSRCVNVNLVNVSYFCVKWSKKCIENKKKLRVVVVGSAAGSVGSRDIGYGIAKSGLNGLVVSLSKCFARDGVSVVGVNPGIFESSMSDSMSVERKNRAVDQTHIKRKGRVGEIVGAVCYFAFEASDFFTGSVVDINGGQYS